MFTSIVVGTNGTSSSRDAVAVAADLAKLHGAKLHLVWAFRPVMQLATAVPMVDTMALSAGPTDSELHEQVAGELARLMSELDCEAEAYPCAQAAAAAILDVADRQHADLIVVGNKGMHGARRVLGSVPNTVAHQARCAVLIVPTV